METKSFENLVIKGEVCKGFFELTVKLIIIFIILMIVIQFISSHSSYKIRIPVMWYINIPKTLFSILAVFAVFFYDFGTQKLQINKFEDMLLSTFLVGIFALIELLTGVATMIKDAFDMLDEK